MPTPVVVAAPATAAAARYRDSDQSVMDELIAFKSRFACREGADEEFLLRWTKLVAMFEASRLAQVEKDFLARGEKPSLSDLRRISEARLEMVADEAKLLRLNPSMQALPYSAAVFEHMRKHVAVVKALNQTVMELKVCPCHLCLCGPNCVWQGHASPGAALWISFQQSPVPVGQAKGSVDLQQINRQRFPRSAKVLRFFCEGWLSGERESVSSQRQPKMELIFSIKAARNNIIDLRAKVNQRDEKGMSLLHLHLDSGLNRKRAPISFDNPVCCFFFFFIFSFKPTFNCL